MKRSAASASRGAPQSSWSHIALQWSEHAMLFIEAAAARRAEPSSPVLLVAPFI